MVRECRCGVQSFSPVPPLPCGVPQQAPEPSEARAITMGAVARTPNVRALTYTQTHKHKEERTTQRRETGEREGETDAETPKQKPRNATRGSGGNERGRHTHPMISFGGATITTLPIGERVPRLRESRGQQMPRGDPTESTCGGHTHTEVTPALSEAAGDAPFLREQPGSGAQHRWHWTSKCAVSLRTETPKKVPKRKT